MKNKIESIFSTNGAQTHNKIYVNIHVCNKKTPSQAQTTILQFGNGYLTSQ